MRHRKGYLVLGLFLLLAGWVVLGGKFFSPGKSSPSAKQSGKPEAIEAQVELCREAQEEGAPTLSGETAAKRKLWVENTGNAPCYVRVRLKLPKAEKKEILELGKLMGEEFVALDFREKEGEPCWVRDGEYFYYRDPETENLLFPGEATLPIYDAVRQNQSLRGKLSSKVDCELIAWAQAVLPQEGKSELEIWTLFER